MFEDLRYRTISYHDTWIAIDPIRGCPYRCSYCVLRYGSGINTQPKRMIDPKECVEKLLHYPLFVRGRTPLSIGCETDILHNRNVDYLVDLLSEFKEADIDNPIVLATKSPLSESVLQRIKRIAGLRVVFFLSYSGLGQRFEPGIDEKQLRTNFWLAKSNGFPVVHYWRPLIPSVNTGLTMIRKMLSFVSRIADAAVFVGLKLHPRLNRITASEVRIRIPKHLIGEFGEWIETKTIEHIYLEGRSICPTFPIYRHSSCALSFVLGIENQTATVFRKDICDPSQCPPSQRKICENARRIPSEDEIVKVLSVLERDIGFERHSDLVFIDGEVTQEEFAFLLHNLNCPLRVGRIRMQNLFRGSIYEGQPQSDSRH